MGYVQEKILCNQPSFSPVAIKRGEWKDGMIVRMPNWLGDAVMAVPALLQLRKVIPKNCGLFVIVPPGLEDLFESMKFVDVVVALHQKHSKWSPDDKKTVGKLRAGVGVLFNNSLRDAFYFKVCGIKNVFGAAARGRSIFLTRAFKFPKIKNKKLNKLHHTARYMAIAYALGAPEWNGELPDFSLHADPEVMEHSVSEAVNASKLLVLAPGAAYGEAKRWPAENFRNVLNYWLEQGGNAAVVGTKAEKSVAEEVVAGIESGQVYNLAGKTSLNELLLLLSKSDYCVANDSGIMHLAALLGVAGTAVFGSTDPTSTSPVSDKWNILYTSEECSPCFKRTCPFDSYKCLKNISAEQVIGTIKKTLSL